MDGENEEFEEMQREETQEVEIPPEHPESCLTDDELEEMRNRGLI